MFTLAVLATACDVADDVTPDPVDTITVEQLMARSADTPVAVTGLLLVSNGTAKLCGEVLESYPPQCGEPSVELVGLDLSRVDGLTTANAVNWKEGMVTTLQRRQDGRFDVLVETESGS